MKESIYTFSEAKVRLESWCAYQERCQFEVDQKLISWGQSSEIRGQLIADLISNNFINEQRYAEAFVSGKFRIKKWGRIKIVSHLRRKFISEYSIKKGLMEIDLDEYWETIVELAAKKKKEFTAKNESIWVQQSKIFRFLQSKGYESDLILDASKEIFNHLQ